MKVENYFILILALFYFTKSGAANEHIVLEIGKRSIVITYYFIEPATRANKKRLQLIQII